jgi:hypothetical protein
MVSGPGDRDFEEDMADIISLWSKGELYAAEFSPENTTGCCSDWCLCAEKAWLLEKVLPRE